jgi:hypothetical protein
MWVRPKHLRIYWRTSWLAFEFPDKFYSKKATSDTFALHLSELTVVKQLNSALRSTPILFEAPDSNEQAVIPGT